jgi:alpha-tubulin suppressor-like RCC1 family protein/uncharacterized protein involved in exopolysaccharide biosynthesis
MSDQTNYSPFPLINLALDNARLLLAVPLGAAAIAVILGLLFGGTYAAESSFKPQSEQSEVGRFSGLAAQFGIDVSGGGGGESIDFYARLARSRALLEEVAQTEFAIPETGRRATLVELYGQDGSETTRLRNTVDLLARRVGVDADINAGVISVYTRATHASLAEQINRAILDGVNRFNLERRQSQAAAERRFVEAQVARAREDLNRAEAEISEFMQSNRRYEEWPQLRMEAARLQRQVDLQQQVFTTLTQALERSRLDEVRNTPVITIIDQPEGSARRQRRLAQRAILGGLLGLTFVLTFVFLRDYTSRLRQQYPEEYERIRKRRPWVAAVALLVLSGCEGSTLEPVAGPVPLLAVTSGALHSCALSTAGDVYCWGNGTAGELGNGSFSGTGRPERVIGAVSFSAISAGDAHTCALDVQGRAWCWGWNAYFQRGNAEDTATARPVRVSGEHRFVQLDAGAHHTCAIDDDGAAWCWGYNRHGQLGDGSTTTPGEPVRVATSVRFSSIAAGGSHTCALTDQVGGGNVYCWGLNTVGQVGASTDVIIASTPLRVNSTVRMTQVSAGADHTCALAGDALYCWGGNARGQLANGGAFPEGLPGTTAPVPSPARERFTFLAAGDRFNCAIGDYARAYCWGEGSAGQLGNGNTAMQFFPQAVVLQPSGGVIFDLVAFRTVSPGRRHVCGSTNEHVVYCWGDGSLGQLGRPGPLSALLPLRVDLRQ